MLDTKQRNEKIFQLMQSAIHDFCKILGCNHFSKNNEVIMVHYKNEEVLFAYPEFNKNDYDINVICMVYENLTMSETAKLKEIYNSEEFTEFIKETEDNIWFLDDSRVVVGFTYTFKYCEFAILKSYLLLNMYMNIEHASKLRNKMDDLLVEREQANAN